MGEKVLKHKFEFSVEINNIALCQCQLEKISKAFIKGIKKGWLQNVGGHPSAINVKQTQYSKQPNDPKFHRRRKAEESGALFVRQVID